MGKLGEMNVFGDHQTDQITTRIPMILHWPGLLDSGASHALSRGYLCYGAGTAGAKSAGHLGRREFYKALKDGFDLGRDFLWCLRPPGRANVGFGLVTIFI